MSILVLKRRVGESVVIGDDIYLTVLGFSNNEVRLSFDAPKTLPINRDENYRRIQREKRDQLIEDRCDLDQTVVDRLIAKFKAQKTTQVNTH